MEVSIVFPYVMTAIGTGIAVVGYMRVRDKDNIQQAKTEGESKGFLVAKLDSIEKSISGVGKDLSSLETKLTTKIESTGKELIEIRERIVKVESKTASAHKRIDDLQAERI